MKIAYIAGWPIPSRVANAVHVMKMCHALAHNKQEVSLFCPAGDPNDAQEGMDIFQQFGVEQNFAFNPISMGGGRLGLILYAFKAALSAKKFKAELILSRCLMSAWMAAFFGIPTIFEKHDSLDNQSAFARAVFSSLIKSKNFKALIVISQALKTHLIERFDLPAERIIVAHDGADPLPDTKTTPAFNKAPNKLHVGYIGHLYQGRGIDVIAATARLLGDVEFHIVGGTPENLAHWKENLADCSNIHFYGHVPHTQTINFLRHFDVLLAPYQSTVGGFGGKGNTVKWMSPLKVFEYMSTGLPTICSDLPVLHEILEDRKNAFLCTPNDPNHWAETIMHIKDNPDEASQIAQAAKLEFLAQYTWKKRAKHICDGVKTLLNSATT